MDFDTSKLKQRGLKRFWLATQYSWKGAKAAFKEEPAFEYEVYAAIILVPMALWLGDNGLESTAMIVAVLFVMLVELINSAIEAVVDRIGPEHHVLSGRAKDLGSAAVFIAITIAVLVWSAVLL